MTKFHRELLDIQYHVQLRGWIRVKGIHRVNS